jgi:hypothetical protein
MYWLVGLFFFSWVKYPGYCGLSKLKAKVCRNEARQEINKMNHTLDARGEGSLLDEAPRLSYFYRRRK